jgi:site-specific recombinase XerD
MFSILSLSVFPITVQERQNRAWVFTLVSTTNFLSQTTNPAIAVKGDKERTIWFGLTTTQALRQYLTRRGELDHNKLFVSHTGEPINRYRVRNIIVERSEQAGISGVRCSPHSLRHTCAVTFLRNGASAFDVQRLLGHSTLDMTKRYVSLVDSDLMDAHAKASPVDNIASIKAKFGRKRLK